jgi:hypothetical protein
MLLVTDKVLQNQEMAARPNVTLLMKAFALERREAHFAPYPADLCRLLLLAGHVPATCGEMPQAHLMTVR